MDRLDQVTGFAGWSDRYEYLGTSPEKVAIKCSLTIAGVTKEDAGEGDDFKSACSDALKRAAVKFGIGRYLYNTESVWSPLDKRGKIENVEAVKKAMLRGSSPREPVTPPADTSPSSVRTIGNGSPRPQVISRQASRSQPYRGGVDDEP